MTFVFDPSAPEVHSDPFPLYKVLRNEHPAYFSEPGNCWVLSRYADITAAVLDTKTFSSAEGNIIDDSPLRAGCRSTGSSRKAHPIPPTTKRFGFSPSQSALADRLEAALRRIKARPHSPPPSAAGAATPGPRSRHGSIRRAG